MTRIKILTPKGICSIKRTVIDKIMDHRKKPNFLGKTQTISGFRRNYRMQSIMCKTRANSMTSSNQTQSLKGSFSTCPSPPSLYSIENRASGSSWLGWRCLSLRKISSKRIRFWVRCKTWVKTTRKILLSLMRIWRTQKARKQKVPKMTC